MIEYRTERLSPEIEDDVISLLSTFGWVVVNSQEVYNESTEVLGVDVKANGAFMRGFTGKDAQINVRQRKSVTNYVTVKFARDTSMPNYERLRALGVEYENRMSVSEPRKPVKRTALTAIGMLIIIVSVIMAITQPSVSAEIWEICVCVIFPLITIPLTVIGWVKYKKNRDYYFSNLSAMGSILDEAAALIE